jgi:hypothetical protein
MMNRKGMILVAVIVVSLVAGTVFAIDIAALDRVSVQMTKSAVLSILGTPDQVADLGAGLKTEVYKVTAMDPMVGAGCIYDKEQVLKGQAFIFEGSQGKQSADRLKQLGFAVMEEKGGTFRLLGKDDDTGHPLVIYIFEKDGVTTVMTFEEAFYRATVK